MLILGSTVIQLITGLGPEVWFTDKTLLLVSFLWVNTNKSLGRVWYLTLSFRSKAKTEMFYLTRIKSFVLIVASKPWVCFGNMFIKLPSSNVQAMLQQGKQIHQEVFSPKKRTLNLTYFSPSVLWRSEELRRGNKQAKERLEAKSFKAPWTGRFVDLLLLHSVVTVLFLILADDKVARPRLSFMMYVARRHCQQHEVIRPQFCKG